MFSIDAIMSTDLITVEPSATLADARELMHANRIHHLPVVTNDGGLVGLVTLTNVLAATDSFLRDAENRIHANEILIKDVMTEEAANKIFDPFSQSKRTESGAGGTGLGLAICREIIDAHHGQIKAESKPDGGSVFTFAIPRTAVEEMVTV